MMPLLAPASSRYSLPYELLDASTAAEQLRTQLTTVHRVNATAHAGDGVAVVLIENVTAWSDGEFWWWWSGRTRRDGRRVYACCPAVNAATAARLIVQHLTSR
ncbi:hypothetical protein ACIBEJ_00595 [Nonomuraea sp. NPDC050790]|uniref:hypothetical protein n=1 Tax=Nonomuraea sp. NPDC050790 TaxID=3364371 RepID=UPI0037A01606